MGLEPDTNTKIGRFRILEPLGSGGAHDVFLAEDEAGTRVVLKILAAPERNQGLFDPRIADEVSTYASLQHPNIIKVLDLFSTEGQFVIALEWVDGASLSVVRAALKRHAGTLGDFAALYVSAAVFSALAAGHEAFDTVGRPAPVVHRNVNPSNVHILWDGAVKLGNFNVANVVTVLRDSSPGVTWGSYGYFAPEQVKQQQVGPAADVYAASLVLWELLSGRKALDRGTMTDAQVLHAMSAPKIPPLETVRTDLDRRLFEALHVGLEVDPAKRTITAAQVRDLLTGLVDMDTEKKRLATTIERVRPAATRPRLASKPGLHSPAKPAPPRPTAKSVPPAHEVPAKPAVAEPDPFNVPLLSLPVPPPSPPPPPPVPPPAPPAPALTPAPPKALTATLPLSGMPAPAIPAAPPPPAPPPPPPPTPAAPAPAPLPPAAPPEAHGPQYSGEAIAFEPEIPLRRRSMLPVVLAACGLVAVLIVAGILFVAREGGPAPTQAAAAPASVPPPPAVAAAPVVPEPVAEPAASVTAAASLVPPPTSPAAVASAPVEPAPQASASSIPDDQGELVFPPFAAGHRIFVDGHVVGDGAQPAVVRCGPHEVRIGSAGTTQHVSVPCGGSVTLSGR